MSAAPFPTPPVGAPGAATAPSRNIILCLDGTGNQFSARNSNLIKLMSVLRVDETQLVYYSSGLGTILPDSTSTWDATKQAVAKLVDEGLAVNFDTFVCDAYQYLMDYYRAGDKIYLFGFSRGAYTARALAGMIQKVGLLAPGNHNQIKLAYEVYSDGDKYKQQFEQLKKPDADPSVLYRRIFGISRTVTIEYLGVWDTVSSLGGFSLPELPFAAGVSSVNVFRQALALDERRARFIPEYRKADEAEKTYLAKIAAAQVDLLKADAKGTAAARTRLEAAQAEMDKVYKPTVRIGAKDIPKSREVWFMGCHSDVGGGNELNDLPALANVSFRWLLRDAVECGLKLDPNGVALLPALHFSDEEISRYGIKDGAVDALNKLAKLLDAPRPPPGEDTPQVEKKLADDTFALWSLLGQNELAKVVELAASLDSVPPTPGTGGGKPALNDDVMSKLHESLTPKWRLLEHVPLISRGYTSKGATDNSPWKINEGNGRQMVPHQKLHRSVLRRLEIEQQNKVVGKDAYLPAAKVPDAWHEWADLKSGKAQLPAEFIEE